MSPLLDAAALRAACSAYPKPADFRPSYGTAGFRAEASLLPSTVFRCGLLIGLRAKAAGQVGEAAASCTPRRVALVAPCLRAHALLQPSPPPLACHTVHDRPAA